MWRGVGPSPPTDVATLSNGVVYAFGASGVPNALDATMLWEHTWEGGGIVQPAVTPDGDILVSGLAGAGGSASAGGPRVAATAGLPRDF